MKMRVSHGVDAIGNTTEQAGKGATLARMQEVLARLLRMRAYQIETYFESLKKKSNKGSRYAEYEADATVLDSKLIKVTVGFPTIRGGDNIQPNLDAEDFFMKVLEKFGLEVVRRKNESQEGRMTCFFRRAYRLTQPSGH